MLERGYVAVQQLVDRGQTKWKGYLSVSSEHRAEFIQEKENLLAFVYLPIALQLP